LGTTTHLGRQKRTNSRTNRTSYDRNVRIHIRTALWTTETLEITPRTTETLEMVSKSIQNVHKIAPKSFKIQEISENAKMRSHSSPLERERLEASENGAKSRAKEGTKTRRTSDINKFSQNDLRGSQNGPQMCAKCFQKMIPKGPRMVQKWTLEITARTPVGSAETFEITARTLLRGQKRSKSLLEPHGYDRHARTHCSNPTWNDRND